MCRCALPAGLAAGVVVILFPAVIAAQVCIPGGG